MTRTRLVFAVLLLLATAITPCFAGSILGAAVDLNEESRLIVDIQFDNLITDPAQAGRIDNYIVLDVESGRFLPIIDVLFKRNGNNLQLLLDPTLRIQQGAHLHLFIKALTLK